MIDFNSTSALSDRINFLIDSAINATAEEEQRRDYLGASVVGHYCERHVQYHLLAAMGEVERKKFPARILRIFDRGNLYEDRARQWLKSAGFVFSDRLYKFSLFDGRFRGHVDGVIVGFDDLNNDCPFLLPVLWENKCLGAKSWKKVQTEKLKSFSSTYYAQVQIYMHTLGLKQCLFSAVNADTMEVYHELVKYDEAEALKYLERVQRVLMTTDMQELVPRCTTIKDYYICKMCDFAGWCWS